MPLKKMRFFIGKDYKKPKAFGFDSDWDFDSGGGDYDNWNSNYTDWGQRLVMSHKRMVITYGVYK